MISSAAVQAGSGAAADVVSWRPAQALPTGAFQIALLTWRQI